MTALTTPHQGFVPVPGEPTGVSYSECEFPNRASEHAICCLWDDAKAVAERRPDAYMVGNCVSEAGVGMLRRTLWANPGIKVLVVVGSDLTGTRAMLREQLAADAGLVDQLVDRDDGDVYYLARDRERVVDPLPPVPEPEVKTRRGAPGLQVVDESLFRVWPRLIRQVVDHGAVSATSYGYRQRELLSPCWVFDAGRTLHLGVPDWFVDLPGVGKDAAALDAYATTSVLEPSEDPAVTYTYGHRLRGRWDDQIARLIDLFTPRERRPEDSDEDYERVVAKTLGQRRGLVSTWDTGARQFTMTVRHADGRVEEGLPLGKIVVEDLYGRAQEVVEAIVDAADLMGRPSDVAGRHPPCLTQVWFRRDEDGSLFVHATFRSHDLWAAGVDNAWALCRLAELVADSIGWPLGRLAITSHSGHVYEPAWEAASALGRARGRRVHDWDDRAILRVRAPTRDERGDDGRLRVCVDLLGPDGRAVEVLSSSSAESAARRALEAGWVTTLSHAAWLGRRCAEVHAQEESSRV